MQANSSNILSPNKSQRRKSGQKQEQVYLLQKKFFGWSSKSKNHSEHQQGNQFMSRRSSQMSGATQLSNHIKQRSQPIILLDPTVQFQNNFMLMHGHDEAVYQIKNLTYAGQTLEQLSESIGYNIEALRQYKSEKTIFNLIEKLLNSHLKFKEISWIFLSNKPRDWTGDFILKKIILNSTKIINRCLQLKKNKPEKQLIQFLYEFNQKVEEMNLKFSEDLYTNLQIQLSIDKQKLRFKEVLLVKQFAQPSKLDNYFFVQNMLKEKHKTNFRLMNSETFQLIHNFEQKHGHFKNIKRITRHTCLGLDKIVNSLAKDPVD